MERLHFPGPPSWFNGGATEQTLPRAKTVTLRPERERQKHTRTHTKKGKERDEEREGGR